MNPNFSVKRHGGLGRAFSRLCQPCLTSSSQPAFPLIRSQFDPSRRKPLLSRCFQHRSSPILCRFLVCLVLTAQAISAAFVIEDPQNALQGTNVPVAIHVKLTASQLRAAQQGRLGLNRSDQPGLICPVQWNLGRLQPEATWLLPGGAGEPLKWRLRPSPEPFELKMKAVEERGQVELREGEQLVLRYNYRTIEPSAEFLAQVSAGNKIYARARSDYIHPLMGPQGEELTRDWAPDHPHHRGIYWAWPEVECGAERGDLHALQRVFARPTGQVRLESGPVYAQVTAESEWRWEDGDPIVREVAIIRAYRASPSGRLIDLAFQFVALKDGVTLARRDTDKYGGLNLRLSRPEGQEIVPWIDPASASPRRAWSDLSGRFAGAAANAGLLVLQHPANPDYPGDWVQYPDLSWCQPTFPQAGRRWPLTRSKPLELRYRLWVHPGSAPASPVAARVWDQYSAPAAAKPEFGLE